MESEAFSITIKNTDHLDFIMEGRQKSFFIPSTVMVRDFPVLENGVWRENLVDIDTGFLTTRRRILSEGSIKVGSSMNVRHPYWECVSGSHRGYVWDINTKVCRSEDGDRLCGFMPYYSEWEHREASTMPKWAGEIYCDVEGVFLHRLSEVGEDEFARCGVHTYDAFTKLHGLEHFSTLVDIPLVTEIRFNIRALEPCAKDAVRGAEVIRFPALPG